MKTCPKCQRVFDASVGFCPTDGTPLTGAGAEPEEQEDPAGLLGKLIDGKYLLEQKVGQGGMGAVYRARHVHMDQPVAVKMLRRDLASDQGTIERFRREALAAARIRHPNAVTVTDFGVSDAGMYLVMEYLEGTDLRRRLREARVIPARETVRLIVEVCAAIDRAHRSGLIHRDLKPDNIWLVRDDETGLEHVKVLDFGIAKLKSTTRDLVALTEQGTVIGTPLYMSPEQCLGQELDVRSDIYSLGVVMYEMLTGRVPFKGDNAVAIGMRHNSEAPRPPRTLNPSIPPAIEAVVLKALAKSKDARQASARALAEELTAALHESGASVDTVALRPGQMAQLSSTADTPQESTLHLASGQATGVSDSSAVTRVLAADTPPRTNPATVQSRRGLRTFAIVAVTAVVAAVAAIGVGLYVSRQHVSPPEESVPSRSATPPPAVPEVEGMTYVPGGILVMGALDPTASPEARPLHPVTVAPFYIDTTEVTNAQYREFVRSGAGVAPPDWKNGDLEPGTERLPVVNVSWTDAAAYAAWAKKRLPTEAEWELAARGFDGRQYPWGDTFSRELANSQEDGATRPAAVGSYPKGASPFGVLDMASNVAEWVADDYEPYPKSTAKRVPGQKVFRGGTYRAPVKDLSAWERFYTKGSDRYAVLGFRCARDAGGSH